MWHVSVQNPACHDSRTCVHIPAVAWEVAWPHDDSGMWYLLELEKDTLFHQVSVTFTVKWKNNNYPLGVVREFSFIYSVFLIYLY